MCEMPPIIPSPVNNSELKGWEVGQLVNQLLTIRSHFTIVGPINALRSLRASRRQARCKRREHRSVANFEFLKDVMEVHFDGAINNVQPAPYFLVRQPFGDQTHDLALA